MNCSVYTMQIIIPKWAYKIVELEDGTYLVIIDEAFLSSLRCPHCNEPLFKSGFYQRHIIKTDGEDIVLKLNRLECRNEHCKYKKAHNLQQAPKFKCRPEVVAMFCRRLLRDMLAGIIVAMRKKLNDDKLLKVYEHLKSSKFYCTYRWLALYSPHSLKQSSISKIARAFISYLPLGLKRLYMCFEDVKEIYFYTLNKRCQMKLAHLPYLAWLSWVLKEYTKSTEFEKLLNAHVISIDTVPSEV